MKGRLPGILAGLVASTLCVCASIVLSAPALAARPGGSSPRAQATLDEVYSNPLRGLSGITPERVDQGVDYSAAGPIYALGTGVVENVYSEGWPNGVFIAYKLTGPGPAEGRVVYAAEDITPSVSVGQEVNASTQIGTVFQGPDGIETGWANPNIVLQNTMAWVSNQWDGADSTAFGLNFSELLATLGASPGIVEGTVQGTLPAEWPTWPAYSVGVEGTSWAFWAEAPEIPAPAVQSVPQAARSASPLFVAMEANHSLWVRSLSQNWTSLTPTLYTYCANDPDAVLTGPASSPELTVACEGGNGALYAATVSVPSGGLPSISAWTDFGATLDALRE
jgi:hypothetical protein